MSEYEEVVAAIHAFPRLAKTGGHERILALLHALGDPQQRGRYIHITGTNGKGSVATTAAHILEESGLTVGLYTSPFIMRFNERFMIDHDPISDAALVAAYHTVAGALHQLQAAQPDFGVTEFEFITALAFWWFDSRGVDAAVIEVGIGGDTDSTNVITPIVSVITSVGLDHQKLLGNTLTSVATHKAGIIKPGVPVVTGSLPAEAETVIAAKTQATGSDWARFDHEFSTSHATLNGWGQRFTYLDSDGRLDGLTLPLLGTYQLSNAAVAIRSAKWFADRIQWPLTAAEIRQGLAKVQWPGRMEKISDDPLIVLDGAHNPQGIHGLVETLDRLFGHQPMTLIAGILKDKAVATIVADLAGTHHRLWLVPVPDNPRAATLADYPPLEGTREFASWQEALAAHLSEYGDEPVVITGSLYLVSAVRQELLGGLGSGEQA
ncbi:bifunctional folylpolyglutamate synthase/dihydrofolate synthase [Lacticaseibacillus mingshuiensis]|uniref:bifunctional folylpolyglutamate synthase/dihydrofolate synthase n=1 Tax=Lacticaseibacillus mingshuiensis TaxID=2799574 RepID=UPI0019526E4F|nr:folylpolyglutamate synthase/dihydrofolate synthase family protein [Lacticaseibacillus mingshuiensis]